MSLASRYMARISEYAEDCAPPYMTEATRSKRAQTIAQLRKATLQKAANK